MSNISKSINGFKNEYDFVNYLNGKLVKNLNPMFREFVDSIYDNITDDMKINCWINQMKQKSDFYIEIDGIIKGISLKIGSRNSVHVEPVSEFIHFLISNNVRRDLVIEYLKYHYADGSTNGKGNRRISVEEYKKANQKGIDEINLCINNEKILEKAIDKFVIKGNNSKNFISAIIHGSVNDFVWITTEDIKRIILSKSYSYSSAIHFGPLTCQPKNRCLNYNPAYEKDRYSVQIKWYSIYDDIIENMNNKCRNKFY